MDNNSNVKINTLINLINDNTPSTINVNLVKNVYINYKSRLRGDTIEVVERNFYINSSKLYKPLTDNEVLLLNSNKFTINNAEELIERINKINF